MAPPRARRFALEHLADLDDEALRTFLAPGEAGVSARLLGIACQGAPAAMVDRLARLLPVDSRQGFDAALTLPAPPADVVAARSEVVDLLFWPLLYWHDPDAYDELVAGEGIHPDILAALDLGGRVVCDVGAGTGRFTVFAASRAAHVVAVDAVPALLERLRDRLAAAGLDNVDIRRGDFARLPVADRSVDVAVSCSALTSRRPFGGERALDEMERIVRPGGRLAVIWPDHPGWFVARGFTEVRAAGNEVMRFTDTAVAERLCREFYSPEAAQWVIDNQAAEVPYEVLGVRPPNDMCVRDLPG